VTDSLFEVRLPDEMGVWSDGGDVVWLPTRYYPSRRGAFRFAREHWQATPRDVYVTHTWMRFQPREWEERWVECEGDERGAFACWRIEAA
jgi:hypothetical protein